jgi:D-aminopeptidase
LNPVFEAPRIGDLPSGSLDSIADVGEVQVGHCTLAKGSVQTGVTVLRTHSQDPFMHKTPAGLAVINGFGKSMGLLQVQELGVLESAIALTNTFAVGNVATAMTRQAVHDNPAIGRSLPTLNPLVLECNDGYLNDLQAFSVEETHFLQASAAASRQFPQGSVGAGRGMSCFGLKGGIGSASRIAATAAGPFTVGALVLANFGRPAALTLAGRLLGPMLAQRTQAGPSVVERGSIIMLLATDAPLDARQLRRLAVRASAGLARTGSDFGHGSGDIALAFSTAYTVPQSDTGVLRSQTLLHEGSMDPLFEAAAQSTEQAIVHALFSAETVWGLEGHARVAIKDVAPDWRSLLDI